MCNCENVKIGSYDNQVTLNSWWNNGQISIDKCLVNEILFLWSNKIQTTGCCCGHNKVKPMINVIESDHKNMVKLGYKFSINQFGTNCYKPKSIL